MERITLEIGVQTEIGKSRSLYAISNLWVSWWSEKKPHLHFIVHTPMNSNSDPGFFIFPVDFVEAVGEIHGLSWLLKDWLGPSKTFYILPLMNSVWFESRWRTSQSVWLCLAPNKMFPLTFECIWLIQSCDINREDALCALLLRRLKKKKDKYCMYIWSWTWRLSMLTQCVHLSPVSMAGLWLSSHLMALGLAQQDFITDVAQSCSVWPTIHR